MAFPLLTCGAQKGVKQMENCGVCVDKRREEKRGAAMAKKVRAEDKNDIGSAKQGASVQPGGPKCEILQSCSLTMFLSVLSERKNVIELEACVNTLSLPSFGKEDRATRQARADAVATKIGEAMMYHWTYVTFNYSVHN